MQILATSPVVKTLFAFAIISSSRITTNHFPKCRPAPSYRRGPAHNLEGSVCSFHKSFFTLAFCASHLTLHASRFYIRSRRANKKGTAAFHARLGPTRALEERESKRCPFYSSIREQPMSCAEQKRRCPLQKQRAPSLLNGSSFTNSSFKSERLESQ